MSKKAIIFDFDGTIADTFEIFLDSLSVLLNRSRDEFPPEKIEKMRNLTFTQIIKALNIKPWQIPRLVIKGRAEMQKRIDQAHIFNGMDKILLLLSENYDLYIVSTNSKKNIEFILKKEELKSCFKEVYGEIGITGKAKALRKLLKDQNLHAQNCVYIGDETRDVTAAKRVGMSCIAVGWGFSSVKALNRYKHDGLVEKPNQIPGAVSNLS